MQEIPKELEEVLKNKLMIGNKQPTAHVQVGEDDEQQIQFPIYDPNKSGKIVVYRTMVEHEGKKVIPYSISNFMLTSKGDYIVAFVHPVNGKICVTRYPDDSFIKQAVVIKDYVEIPNAPKLNRISQSKLKMLKSSKGFIIVVADAGNDKIVGDPDAKSMTYSIVSNDHTGDVATFNQVSTVVQGVAPLTDTYAPVSKPYQAKDGSIWVLTPQSYMYDASNSFQKGFIMKSKDHGKSWEKMHEVAVGLGSHLAMLGSFYETNDGSISIIVTYSNASCNLFTSPDNGATWSAIGVSGGLWKAPFTGTFVDYMGITLCVYGRGVQDGSVIGYMANPTPKDLANCHEWKKIFTGEFGNGFYGDRTTDVELVGDQLHISSACDIAGFVPPPPISTKIPVVSIGIDRAKKMVSGATIVIPNIGGEYAPDGTANPKLVWVNKKIKVFQGYGKHKIQTFTGLIDTIEMDAKAETLTLNCRDMLQMAVDHTVTDNNGSHTIAFKDVYIHDIWKKMMSLCGLKVGVVENTGVKIKEKIVSWESYFDVTSWCDEIAGFETTCDEFGVVHFRKDGKPKHAKINWNFKEGENITSLGYTLDNNELYHTVVVFGSKTVKDAQGNEKEEVITYSAKYPAHKYMNLQPHRILKIDAFECDTKEQLKSICDDALYLMTTRARTVQFEAVAIPHIQIGDFIRVEETTTTISEIYRVTNLSINQSNGSYLMNITCYHHGQFES